MKSVKTLAGKNAVLTGGSRGIGPSLGLALAQQGVNLVLVARTTDRLERVAHELSQFGVRAVPLPADLTATMGLEALLRQAETELGPIDFLINNAAIEQLGAFAQLSLEKVQAIVATNLTAPLLLTRLALPGMLARRSGHIVNIASMAGKKTPPYNAVYGATKAALIEWTGALRGELEGSGVSASVVCPGFISEAGMFIDHFAGQRPPWLIGESPPAAVAQAVIQALRQDRQEVLVTPRPVRPLLALGALWPELGNIFLKWIGVVELFRQAANKPD